MNPLYNNEQFENATYQELLPLKCKNCNNTFYKKKKNVLDIIKGIGRKTGDFCGNKCRQLFENPPILVNCKTCGKEFKKTRGEIAATNNNFCSRSCAATFNNQFHKNHMLKQGKCKKCGTVIHANVEYCVECRIKVKGKFFVEAATNPNWWKNITIKEVRGNILYQKNSTIRQISRKSYMQSDNPKHCMKCGYNKHIEVCHIKAIKNFDEQITLEEVNNPSNLLGLCKNCHWEFDHNLLTLQEIQSSQYYKLVLPP